MYTKMIVLPAFTFALIASLFLNSSRLEGQKNPAPQGESASITASSSLAVYSPEELRSHNNATSCWTSIGRNVYDLTAYIPRHQGGPGAILQICGKDGTTLFSGQHASDKGANKALERMKIGTLK